MISLEFTALQAPRVEIENSRHAVGVVHLWWRLLGPFTLPVLLVAGLGTTFNHETLSFNFETCTAFVAATTVSLVAVARPVFGRRPVAWSSVPGAGTSVRARAPNSEMVAAG